MINNKHVKTIFNRYPEICEYGLKTKEECQQPIASWGIECGYGWYKLIDNTLKQINDYCKEYEFLPTNIYFNVNTTYSVGVTTNMVININGDVLNYGDEPPLPNGTLSKGPWHFNVKSAETL